MQAWLFTGAHEPLQRIEREVPVPAEGEVLVEVRGRACAIATSGAWTAR